MKKILAIALISLLISVKAQAQKKVLRHVVLFGFTKNTSAEKIREIEVAFATLPSQIKEPREPESRIDTLFFCHLQKRGRP
jgi:hypothetical protein